MSGEELIRPKALARAIRQTDRLTHQAREMVAAMEMQAAGSANTSLKSAVDAYVAQMSAQRAAADKWAAEGSAQRAAADKQAAQMVAQTAAVASIMTGNKAAVAAMLEAAEAIGRQTRQMQAQIARAREPILGDAVMDRLSAIAGMELPALRVSSLEALGTVTREAGLEDMVESAAATFPGLDEVVRDARAGVPSAGAVTWSRDDVAFGIRAALVLATLWVALWLATGEDEWRWSVGTLLEWLGLKEAVDAAGNWARRRPSGLPGESGG